MMHNQNDMDQDFCLEELQSVCELYGFNEPFGCDSIPRKLKEENIYDPFVWIQLPNDEFAIKLLQRCLRIKYIYDIFYRSPDMNKIVNYVNKNVDSILNSSLAKTNTNNKEEQEQQEQERFRFRLRSVWYGKKCSFNAQKEDIERFEFFLNKIRENYSHYSISLNDANVEFHIIQDYGDATHFGLSKARDKAYRIFFGRMIGNTSISSCGINSSRNIIHKYNLKDRLYIGPTSLDCELSFLMCNQGHVKNGSIIFDPFCGTGSLLISAAHYGAITYGSDIDIRVLKGYNKNYKNITKQMKQKNKKEKEKQKEEKKENKENEKVRKRNNIFSNFGAYSLPYPELIRSDLSSCIWHNSNNNNSGYLFDCIICDPPYGLRAGGRKSGTNKIIREIPINMRNTHKPRTQIYNASDCMTDLLIFASKFLKINGRLVYLLPATINYTDKDLPKHPCFNIVANSEQQCQGLFRRRLITMVKIKQYHPNDKV